MTRIGILGGGQLALMLAHAALKLNHSVVIWDPNSDACARHLGYFINAPFEDERALSQFLSQVDVVTWEFENLPIQQLKIIQEQCLMRPSLSLLEIKRDRLTEKQHLESLDIPVAPFYAIESKDDIRVFPVLLKRRYDGYDGKGQYLITSPSACEALSVDIGSGDFIAEAVIDFDYEFSIVGSRDQSGDIVTYDLSQNVHRNGILHVSTVIKGSCHHVLAQRYLSRLMVYHDYVGTLAVEFFVVNDKLMVNECAPRVHNTGHWTIEGAVTSQFENHIRAITAMPLGQTTTYHYPAMVNVIGTAMPSKAFDFDCESGIFFHDYSKQERRGRKLGHITIVSETLFQRDQLVKWYEEGTFVS